MVRQLILTALVLCAVLTINAQVQPPVSPPADTLTRDTAKIKAPVATSKRVDTLKPKYVNPGKIAGRRAALRSAMVPGLGQIGNGVTVYRLAKVAGIYVGATLLTLSYIDNNKNFHRFTDEIAARGKNDDKPVDPGLTRYPTSGLITGKGTFQRNREVIVFSFVGLYLLNITEAYIDARLKYWDVGEVAFKVSPGLINTGTMYGFNSMTPGLKITIAL
ncbi:MAG: hypothetical protein EOO92_05020 [Pedobacter sp.]|nr:MAG: hypothetical protein EOO92_05020 [Pedobacter sp.]